MTAVIWPHRASPFDKLGPKEKNARTPSAAPDALARRAIRIVMAGGGTGGHLYPGLAVAEALQEQLGDRLELIWAATPRPVDQRLLSRFGERYVQQPVQPLVKKLSRLWAFWNGWQNSCLYWKKAFARQPVDAVLALGGYAAGPAAYVAARHKVPMALLNPDAVPGLANRFLLKRAQRIFSQWELPPAMSAGIRGQVMPLGCPIRESLLNRGREEGAARLGLDATRPVLVICGGSLAAKTINDAMVTLLGDPEARAALAGDVPAGMAGAASAGTPWQIVHLAGTEQAAAVRAAYEPIKEVSWKVLDYCDDMASVWAVADLALARSGASTCAELTACGVPSILLPYPFHRDQHQKHNAQQLVDAGAALLVDDQKEAQANARGIKTPLLSLLYNRQNREQMAARARSAGKPYAARAIARELLALVRP